MAHRKTPIPFPETGKRIRLYRQLRGYSAAELAQYIDIDSKYLSSLESGHQMPSIKILYRLSILLNVPIENLLCEPPETIQSKPIKSQLLQDIERYTDEELKIVQPVCRETRLCVRHTPGLGHVAAKGGEYRESQGSPGTATWPVF